MFQYSQIAATTVTLNNLKHKDMTHIDMVDKFLNGDGSELMQIQRTMNLEATGNLALDKNLSARIRSGSRETMGADGKGMRIFKGIISGGLSEAQRKVQRNKLNKTTTGGITPPAPAPSPAPIPDPAPAAAPGFNWLLWGSIGGGVILLGIGGLIWYKATH